MTQNDESRRDRIAPSDRRSVGLIAADGFVDPDGGVALDDDRRLMATLTAHALHEFGHASTRIRAGPHRRESARRKQRFYAGFVGCEDCAGGRPSFAARKRRTSRTTGSTVRPM